MLKIRSIKKKDIKELAKVYSETYTKKYSGEDWTIKKAEKYLTHMFNRQPDVAFLAELDKKIIGGYLGTIVPWCDGNHLTDGDIFVHPNYQKRGAGLKLGIALYSRAVQKYDCVKSESFTFKNQKFPLNWHEKRGFKVSDEWVMIEGDTKEMLKRMKAMK